MLPSQALSSKPAFGLGGYDSDFSDDEGDEEKSGHKKKRTRYDDALLKKPFQKEKYGKVAHNKVAADEWDREEARNWRCHLISMDAFARHKKFVNDYFLYYGGKKDDFKRSQEKDKTDLDVIRENHRFLWQEEDEVEMTWEKRMARKYYDKLFKEYCIADLSKYKQNQFGFRWRVEKEVISGKGQFFCGNKHCDEKEGLKSWEVNFGYLEHGEKRNALVKLRLCPECSYKLNFHHRRREVKPNRKRQQTEEINEEPSSKKSKLSLSPKSRGKKKKGKGDLSSNRTDGPDNDDCRPDGHPKLQLEECTLISSGCFYPSDSSAKTYPQLSGQEDSEDQEGPSDANYWKGPLQETDEKTREEEFDDYFQDMFL